MHGQPHIKFILCFSALWYVGSLSSPNSFSGISFNKREVLTQRNFLYYSSFTLHAVVLKLKGNIVPRSSVHNVSTLNALVQGLKSADPPNNTEDIRIVLVK